MTSTHRAVSRRSGRWAWSLAATCVSCAVIVLLALPALAALAAALTALTALALEGARSRWRGTSLGRWESWQLRLSQDPDHRLDAKFNLVTRTILVDDEWCTLPQDMREAILAHEAGHGADRASLLLLVPACARTVVPLAILWWIYARMGPWFLALAVAVPLATFLLSAWAISGYRPSRRLTTLAKGLVLAATTGVLAVIGAWPALGALAALTVAVACERAAARSAEYRADAFAAQAGHGPALAGALTALEATSGQRPRRRAHLFDDHPSTTQRVRALARPLAPTSGA